MQVPLDNQSSPIIWGGVPQGAKNPVKDSGL